MKDMMDEKGWSTDQRTSNKKWMEKKDRHVNREHTGKGMHILKRQFNKKRKKTETQYANIQGHE